MRNERFGMTRGMGGRSSQIVRASMITLSLFSAPNCHPEFISGSLGRTRGQEKDSETSSE